MFALTELGFLGQTIGAQDDVDRNQEEPHRRGRRAKAALRPEDLLPQGRRRPGKMDIEEVATEDKLEEQLDDWAPGLPASEPAQK